MVVARIEDGHIHILDKLKEMVRLRAGLDENNQLNEEARKRALVCLERFGERVENLPLGSVAAVGTKTLRQAKNSKQFLKKAAKALGHPISIIAGKEEARLIYLGVSHSLAKEDGRRLVMDIGGGSTELIIGEDFEPLHLRSLDMGCVSISKSCFADDKLEKQNWQKAKIAAHMQLRPVRHPYRNIGWNSVTGASGTIKTAGRIIHRLNSDYYDITLDRLYMVRDKMIKAGNLSKLELPGLGEDRKPVFAGGLAVLIAAFEALHIKKMQVSDGALREGLLYDRLGRIQREDIRLDTITHTQERFGISREHARRVSKTAQQLLNFVEEDWQLQLEHAEILHWASSLHEIGLAVAHSGYHKHGAYLLDNADLPGFSFEEQDWMSVLVRCHRKRIAEELYSMLPSHSFQTAVRLTVLLRLAAMLHRSRKDERAAIKNLTVTNDGLKVQFKKNELKNHPLHLVSLKQEAAYLKEVAFKLEYS